MNQINHLKESTISQISQEDLKDNSQAWCNELTAIIKKLLKEKKISNIELAKKIGISNEQLDRIFFADTYYTVPTIIKIQDALNVVFKVSMALIGDGDLWHNSLSLMPKPLSPC